MATPKSAVQDLSSSYTPSKHPPNPSPISQLPVNPAAPPTPTFIFPAGSRGTKSTIARFAISLRFLPSRNPRLYKYYRNNIINHYRVNPAPTLTFTDARKTLVGDVGSIRRVFYFLETWGLINYSPSVLNKCLMWEDKGTEAAFLRTEALACVLKDDSTRIKMSPEMRV